MPRKTKSEYVLGVEKVLNTPSMSFMANPKVFNEIHKQSGMSLENMFRHIGRSSKAKEYKPSDSERSEARLNNLQVKSDQK
jgi:hypothetical protein